MSELVKLTKLHQDTPRLLLPTNKYLPARVGPTYQLINPELTPVLISNILSSKYLAVDFESTGLDYTDPEQYPVGIGLAWDSGSCYFSLSRVGENIEADEFKWYLFTKVLARCPKLIAHNMYFDAGWYARIVGNLDNWYFCTYAGVAHLANEGYTGKPSGWSIKSCMTEFLGWTSSNETELDQWLVANKYYTGITRVDESEDNLVSQLNQERLKPDKSQMWRAPVEILGKYCILDAEASYLLFTRIILPAFNKYLDLNKFLVGDFTKHIKLHVEQKFIGIKLDREKLSQVANTTKARLEILSSEFCKLPELQEGISNIEKFLITKKLKKEPRKYRIQKQRQEPEKFTKKGELSRNWEKWFELQQQEPQISRSWLNWCSRTKKLQEETKFNIQSADQLRMLFYEELHYPILIETDKFEPSTAVKAIRNFGQAGKLLEEYVGLNKELGYINAYLKLSERDGRLRPNFRLPGAKTGRLTGSAPNFQQVPKTKEILGCFQADEGHSFVDVDFSALESVVAAELSQDPNLIYLYRDGGTGNDVHLFIGAQLPGKIGEKILASGYTPYNPTAEAISKAKKECKHERSICKTTVYACIAEDTLIMTNLGYKKIQHINHTDLVWDGKELVRTNGAQFMGIRKCIKWDGLYVTPDHKFLDENYQWKRADELARKEFFPLILGSFDGALESLIRRFKLRKQPKEKVCKTYDLINCGPRNQFAVGQFIAHNCQFGAGTRKVHQQLEEDGIDISFEEVLEVHKTYWKVFARLKQYSQELQLDLKRSGGILLNGLSRPMCVPEECSKDALSRVIQSTGHDLLVKYVQIICTELDKAGIEYKPILVDLHDATTFQVPDSWVEQTKQIFAKSLDLLNLEVAGTLKLSGKPTSGKSLAECKEVEE